MLKLVLIECDHSHVQITKNSMCCAGAIGYQCPFYQKSIIKETYYSAKNDKRFGHKWGPSSVLANCMDLMTEP